jgi:hypothetical protein
MVGIPERIVGHPATLLLCIALLALAEIWR